MPSGTRTSEPESTGVAAKMPNSVSLKPSCSFTGMPTTASIIHTIKHTVNASVLDASTEYCLYFCEAIAAVLSVFKANIFLQCKLTALCLP